MELSMKSFAVAVVCVSVASAAAAQDSLGAAKDLYAAAAYEEALSTLTRLNTAGAESSATSEIDQYRAFCLFALGRTGEAESIAEAVLTKEPLLSLDARDASPRIVAMFEAVRARILPRVIRDEYKSARTALDRKEFSDALPALEHVSRMIDAARKSGAPDDALGDLGVLVDGFTELARSTVETRAAAEQAQRANMSATPARAGDPLYDASSPDVSPPVVLTQQVPPVPPALRTVMARGRAGVLDIVIDKDGNVDHVAMRESVNAMYDKLVLTAARSWKYKPATKDGVPVRYQKSVTLALQ
jgi:TonB family protein